MKPNTKTTKPRPAAGVMDELFAVTPPRSYNAEPQPKSQTDETPDGARKGAGFLMIDPFKIKTPDQVRDDWETDDDDASDLRESISELSAAGGGIEGTGIFTPINVKRNDGEDAADFPFVIKKGFRRLAQARRLQLPEIPAIETETNEAVEAVEQIVENLQRKGLRPLQTARGLENLKAATGLSIRDMAAKIGKGRGYVDHHLALLRYGDDVQLLVQQRPDTLAIARDIDRIEAQPLRSELIKASANGASSRDVQKRIEQEKERTAPAAAAPAAAAPAAQAELFPVEPAAAFNVGDRAHFQTPTAGKVEVEILRVYGDGTVEIRSEELGASARVNAGEVIRIDARAEELKGKGFSQFARELEGSSHAAPVAPAPPTAFKMGERVKWFGTFGTRYGHIEGVLDGGKYRIRPIAATKNGNMAALLTMEDHEFLIDNEGEEEEPEPEEIVARTADTAQPPTNAEQMFAAEIADRLEAMKAEIERMRWHLSHTAPSDDDKKRVRAALIEVSTVAIDATDEMDGAGNA